MPLLVWIILFSLLGGAVSALGAGLLVVSNLSLRRGILPHLVSYATGALLGAAFLGLLPHAIQSVGLDHVHAIGAAVLAGLLGFFVMEKAVLWRHSHGEHSEADDARHDLHRRQAIGVMVLFGDGLHNFLDGILIAAAFLTDFHLGVVTSIAVIAHEVPQEIGDVAVLLHSGMSAARAMLFNIAASLTTILGGIGAYFWLEQVQSAQPYVLAVAAASLIYIAVADLIPGLHRRTDPRTSVLQLVFILFGVCTIFLVHNALH